jgi:hypothetical protein
MTNLPNPDQSGEELTADFLKQLTRVGVDFREASPLLHEIEPPQEHENADGTTEVTFTIDASGIVETLRKLPDGVGTDAFVRAYNARFTDLDLPAS